MARKRSQEEERKRTRFRTYRNILEYRMAKNEPCIYCNKIVEVLHHRDEDHSNNRSENLISMCKDHHRMQEHASDSPSLKFEEDAIAINPLSWKPSRRKRMVKIGGFLVPGEAVVNSTPQPLPWDSCRNSTDRGRDELFWKIRFKHPDTDNRLTATGSRRLMKLLEGWGWKEIPRE